MPLNLLRRHLIKKEDGEFKLEFKKDINEMFYSRYHAV